MCRDLDRAQRVELLTVALELVPLFTEAYFWRGILGVNVWDNRKDLEKALHLVPLENPYKSLLVKSQIFAMKRNPDKAVDVLAEALQFASNDGEKGEVSYFGAFANWWVDNDESAIYDCKLAIHYKYNTKSALTHLADMRRFLNAPASEITDYYERSLLPTPRHTEQLKYGTYLLKKSEVNQAVMHIEAAIERNPTSPDGYAQLAFIKNREHNLRKTVEFDKFSQSIPQRCMLATMLAHDENNDNGYPEAIDILTEGITRNPCTELYLRRGSLRVESFGEEKARGIEDLRIAVRLNPSNPDAQLALARALEIYGKKGEGENNDTKEVMQRYRNAIYLSPKRMQLAEAKKQQVLEVEQPEFFFYPGEDLGLYKHLKYSSVYQYVGITRKALHLLIKFSEDQRILWSIFRKYTEQLYTWLASPNPTISSITASALDKLWKQSPDPSVYLQHATSQSGKTPGQWATLDLGPGADNLKLDHVVVTSDIPEDFFRSVVACMDKDTLSAFVNFLYRCDTCVSATTLLQLFGISRAIPVLDEFLLSNFSVVRRGLSPMDDCRFELRFSKIPKDLSKYVNNSLYSDVTFVLESSVEIPAHKAVLSRYAYFEGMFGAGLRESKQHRIPLPDLGSEEFIQVMTFVYGGSVKFSGDNCIEILRIADVFGLEDLKILAELFLGNHVDGENAEDLLEISQFFNAPRLMQIARDFNRI
eukprot:TRINITY_DN4813_c0_g1_i1.p1 TRINITY_DN4813_c0_g1~~TRINITY_DN4813_c0_g1_i1.p1  ORF type:complete len:704 (-),score=87.72 TRINITY_DN4813_c0_g1_i1:144-2255(-)